MKILLFLPLLLFTPFLLASEEEVSSTGFFVSNSNFRADYTLYLGTHPSRIQDYIEEANPNSRAYSRELANEVLNVSSCLGVDPVFMTALIHKESTFYPDAVSRTGAVGLTQMTGAAINELKDQLGLRGREHSRYSNSRYLTRTLRQCMGASEFEAFLQALKSSRIGMKRAVKRHRIWAVYSGAAVLKVYLADAMDELGRGADMNLVYQKALEQYNGDTNKERYARAVIALARNFNESF